MFHYYPRRYEDRSAVLAVSEAVPGERLTVRGKVQSCSLFRPRPGSTLLRAVFSDGKKPLHVTWFNMPYLAKTLVHGADVILHGNVERSGAKLVMAHPEFEFVPAGGIPVHSGRIVPVYPLTEDLGQKSLRQILWKLQDEISSLVRDVLPEDVRQRRGLPPLADALREIHFPSSGAALERARRRLVFDELFLLQLGIQAKKAALTKEDASLSHRGGDDAVKRFVESLDYPLTDAQERALKDVMGDMMRTRPMRRIVQGEVGSGKTVVACAAAIFAAANGRQAAVMAPTEALARQLFMSLTRFLEPLGFKTAYVAQGAPPAERAAALEAARRGEASVVVGTHALIQSDVTFARLGLAIIDEQHKFGVWQREALEKKSAATPHVLMLTATPIPRTLALTLYGDLDVTAMAELPKGRRPVKTMWVEESRREEIYAFVDAAVEAGRQAYVVCPRIEGETDVKSAAAQHAELSRIFAHRRVGLLHGRMKPAEKSAVMQAFKEGSLQVLVSTVVVEVGIDVPNATILLVEDAERFGLAQLHQLRGRVGRGAEESYCFVFSGADAEESLERISAFTETRSGFDIAEKDLELRGSGDLAGYRQHGYPAFRIADLSRDFALLMEAREEAIAIVSPDPALAAPANQPLARAVRARFGAEAARAALS